MQQAGRIQAAIDVLGDVIRQHTPVNMALRDWGKANRFAGSKDRTAIGNYVHDVLRYKSSLAWQMDEDTPRALILGLLVHHYEEEPETLSEMIKTAKYGPKPITADELSRLKKGLPLKDAPLWVQANVPEWLWPAFENNFGDNAVSEGQALCARAGLDLRVNTLKGNRKTLVKTLESFGVMPTPLSPVGLRVLPQTGALSRLPNIQIEPCYQMGEVDIQDEGSQLLSLLVNAKLGEKILDLCAGGGGKTLALAADTHDKADIYAFDIDKRRLAPLYQRAKRAGADSLHIINPPYKNLTDLKGKMDKVVIDAPCTGVGTWRRKPDTKWRLKLETLETRLNEQEKILDNAASYLRPGGLLFYMTCSVLAEENEGRIYPFLENHPEFTLLSAGEVWEERFGVNGPKPWSEDGCSLTLTPALTGTDGFFFAVMEKAAHK